jgi:Xaa-Pro aminopeptidase
MDNLVRAKVRQAQSLLREFRLPAWIAQFSRETYDHPEPIQHLLVGTTVTWPAAFIITPEKSTAIVGTGDVANVRDVGAYDDVIGYVKDVGPPLRDYLDSIDPGPICVSWSRQDESADNLTHGMYLMLIECLQDTPYERRLRSAEDLAIALRARKSAEEVERIERAISVTDELFEEIEGWLYQDLTERELFEKVHESLSRRGLQTAWDERYDPVVNFGPESKVGHAAPGDIRLQPGMLVHVDLGVRVAGYCSDLQRMWYVAAAGEDRPPGDVLAPFDTVVKSMRVGFDVLRPGVPGWRVDEAARNVLTSAGYEEPEFAFGHQLGQSTHDAGALLGPRWPRYGRRPEMLIEEENVFTLEYSLPSPAGQIGVEEDVLVSADATRYLSKPQTELRIVRKV